MHIFFLKVSLQNESKFLSWLWKCTHIEKISNMKTTSNMMIYKLEYEDSLNSTKPSQFYQNKPTKPSIPN